MISKNRKVILFLVLIFMINMKVNSQTVLTIGEVFDYEIGDEFHRASIRSTDSPNALRSKIINKTISQNGDSVIYQISHNNYYSVFSTFSTPHLDYFYSQDTTIEIYTNLNTSVFSYPNLSPGVYFIDSLCDSIMTYDSCNSEINGFQCSFNSFEPIHILNKYGKGLGTVHHSYFDASDFTGDSEKNTILFYYKKNNVECGNPDNNYLIIEEYDHDDLIKVYQNELDKCIVVNLDKTLDQKCKVNLVDLTGKLIYSEALEKEIRIGTDHLNSGLYFINIQFADRFITRKLFLK